MNLTQYVTLKVRAPDTMKMLGAIAGTMSDLTLATNTHSKILSESEADATQKWDRMKELQNELQAAESHAKVAQSTAVEAETNFATVLDKKLEVSGMIATLFEEITG